MIVLTTEIMEMIFTASSYQQMRLLLKMDATFSAAKHKISQLVGVPANRVSRTYPAFIADD